MFAVMDGGRYYSTAKQNISKDLIDSFGVPNIEASTLKTGVQR